MSSDSNDSRLSLLKPSHIHRLCNLVDGELAVAAYDDWRNGNACTQDEVNEIIQELIDADLDYLATGVIESNDQYRKSH